ncbi:MAG: amidohydrolase family protein [Planctomycetota bacterium]
MTRVRDMGGHGPTLRGLRDRASELGLPSIHLSAVIARPGWMARDPRAAASAPGDRPGEQPWMAGISTADEAERAAADAVAFGADGLKLYADLPVDVVEALVRAGARHGLGVWSQATIFPARPSEVVRAGVRSLSHAEMIFLETDEDLPATYHAASFGGRTPAEAGSPGLGPLFQLMHERGVFLEPTLTVTRIRAARKIIGEEHARATYELVGRAWRSGVRIVAGTDLMSTPGMPVPNLHMELELLVDEAGLTAEAALRGATLHTAEMLGLGEDLGTVEPGMIADLLVLERNPLEDIRATSEIAIVMRAGEVVSP